MLEYNELWKGKWVSVVSPKENPYESVHEKDVICVMVRLADTDKWLVRQELCPPYDLKEEKYDAKRRWYTTITGKIEDGEDPLVAAIREIGEESEIRINDFEVVRQHRNIPVCKSTDMRSYWYVINVKSYSRAKPEGDGTFYESQSHTIEISLDDLSKKFNSDNFYDSLILTGYHMAKTATFK
jgi:8-oxo-dGTP pyrophosphatase MutT (NUDIX family)